MLSAGIAMNQYQKDARPPDINVDRPSLIYVPMWQWYEMCVRKRIAESQH